MSAVGTVMEAGRAEGVPLAVGTLYDDRKRNLEVMSVPGCYVPFVGIAHVSEHDFLYIGHTRFALSGR